MDITSFFGPTTPQAPQSASASSAKPETAASSAAASPMLPGKDTVNLSAEAVNRLSEEMLRTSIGEKLGASFAELGIDLEASVGVDFSPEATAQRIVGFATGLKDAFLRQNQDLSEEDAIDKFEDTVRSAVKRGAGEAQELLQGMGLLEQTKETTEATMDHVDRLFDEYFTKLRAGVGDASAETVSAAQ